MYPVAAYEAAWLPESLRPVEVHLSLVEMRRGRKKTYWLRVGAVRADGQWQELAWLSCEAGRLMMARPDDWVALAAVDPAEHFMVT